MSTLLIVYKISLQIYMAVIAFLFTKRKMFPHLPHFHPLPHVQNDHLASVSSVSVLFYCNLHLTSQVTLQSRTRLLLGPN